MNEMMSIASLVALVAGVMVAVFVVVTVILYRSVKERLKTNDNTYHKIIRNQSDRV